jgi:hypothetical protein
MKLFKLIGNLLPANAVCDVNLKHLIVEVGTGIATL